MFYHILPKSESRVCVCGCVGVNMCSGDCIMCPIVEAHSCLAATNIQLLHSQVLQWACNICALN